MTDEALRAALEAAIRACETQRRGWGQRALTAFRKALDGRGLVLTDRANVEAEWHDGYRTGWRDRLFGYQGGLGGNPLRFTKVDGAENMPPQAPAEPQDARDLCEMPPEALSWDDGSNFPKPIDDDHMQCACGHIFGDRTEWHECENGTYQFVLHSDRPSNPTTDRVIDRWLKPPKPDPKADAEKAREERFAKAGEAIARGMG